MIEVVTVLRYFYSTEPEVALELPDDTLGTKILTQQQKWKYIFSNEIVIIILHVNVGDKGVFRLSKNVQKSTNRLLHIKSRLEQELHLKFNAEVPVLDTLTKTTQML